MGKPKRQIRICLGIINADTESTVEGYMSAFIAKLCPTRLEVRPIKGADDYVQELITSMDYTIRTTQQSEVRTYFSRLQTLADQVHNYLIPFFPRHEPQNVKVYFVVHFANLQWDLRVLMGILFFGTTLEFDVVGEASDMVQLVWGRIIFRDFLRVTGFRSIKMAGLVCFNAHKLEGEEVYKMKKADIPRYYNDYSETKKAYIENDVDVMNESLNIIINRNENRTMLYTDELPLTSTGFSRWRMNHNEEVIFYDGKKHNTYAVVNRIWKRTRPFLAFFMRAYKGGLCGVHPVSQYKLLSKIACYDAVSMYPHKMLYFRMMQPHYSGQTYESDTPLDQDQEASQLWENILKYTADRNTDGLPNWEPDRIDHGILPWMGEVEITIKGLRQHDHVMSIPCLSKYKIELTPKALREAEEEGTIISANGKVLYASHITVITSSVDLYLMHLCYDMEVHYIRTVVYMQWEYMDFIQKRDVWEAYKRKQHISEVAKRPQDANDEYWIKEAGFNPEHLKQMSAEEYKVFIKQYKQMIKGDVNGKYGLTVESPIHSETQVVKTEDGLFDVVVTESVLHKVVKLIIEPERAPEHVKNNDYCAGSSITMWARWHLILLSNFLYEHGFQTHYTDTDSVFVDDCPEVQQLVSTFNTWMLDHYHVCYLSDEDEEQIDYEETGNIGTMELDKQCQYFMSLGAKCYAYIDTKGNPNITVAGLNAQNYAHWMKAQMEEGEPIQGMLLKWFRPNTFITPKGTKKLLISRVDEGFDEDGLWRGPVLTPVGFQLVNTASRFHIHNMRVAAYMQGLTEDYYIGKYTSSGNQYVTDTGIYTQQEYEDKFIDTDPYLDILEVIEDQQPIKGGLIKLAHTLLKTQ